MNPPWLLTSSILAGQTQADFWLPLSYSLLTSCIDAPWLPATKRWTRKCCIFICCWRKSFAPSLLEATNVYRLVFPMCTGGTVNVKFHATAIVDPTVLSLRPRLCFLASGQHRVSFFHCYKPPLPPPPKTLPLLCSWKHLLAPRCILVIFCVVCFGSSSVSHHSHLMAGCSPAHCVVSHIARVCHSRHTACAPAASVIVAQTTAITSAFIYIYKTIAVLHL